MTKKLLVELTDIIHSEESNKNIQWGPFKVERYTLAVCNQQHLLQVSRLSNTEETSVRALQSTAHGSNVCHVAVAVHLVLGWQNYEFQGARTHRVFQKISGLSECCLLDFTVQKKVYSSDRDVHGGTEIEKSNYPALLTHTALGCLSVGRLLSIHRAASGELCGTDTGFVNCVCQNLRKIAAQWRGSC